MIKNNIAILQMPGFKKAYKRLHASQKNTTNKAIATIVENPLLGEAKKGDLAGLYVYKFNCVNQEFFLAYEFDPETRVLMALGVHENFYRDLKRS